MALTLDDQSSANATATDNAHPLFFELSAPGQLEIPRDYLGALVAASNLPLPPLP